MKIVTWNVNGLRVVLRKDALDWVFKDPPDACCLQEIKARPDQLSQGQLDRFNRFHPSWNPAQRPGYSGVATFSTRKPDRVQLGLGNDDFDREGRVVETHFGDLVLFNLYVPNGQRDHERLNFKLEFYSELLQRCSQLHSEGKRLVLCGDMNTAHQEIDLANPKQNQKTSGFMPVERDWITKILENGFVDIYRKLYPEKVEYTWWTYRMNARQRNIGWRLDYYLVSEELVDQISEVNILADLHGSDHCPVELTLQED